MILELMYITNDEKIALLAEKYGVDRIWIDLEILGKEERQRGRNTVISNHSVEDVRKIRDVLETAKLQVRINPINENSKTEIDKVIEYGADIVMLPMYRSLEEVETFVKMVDGRAKTLLLAETIEAENIIYEAAMIDGVDEVHIGLNDLHLEHGESFMFELLSNGTLDKMCAKLKKTGKPYGFGGIARVGGGLLPAEHIIAEHKRLGSTRVILSRSFTHLEDKHGLEEIEHMFESGLKDLRDFCKYLDNRDEEYFQINRERVATEVSYIVDKIRG